MYRTKLLLAFVALLGLSLAGAAASFWGAQQSRYHLERSRLAHEVLEGHLRLSSETYKLFKQFADMMLIGDAVGGVDEAAARERLRAEISRLRDLIATEVAFVEDDERESEKDELDRLARIERQIDQVLAGFAAVRTLIADGRPAEAWAMLSGILEHSIDTAFNDLIDAAIASESAEVEETNAAADALTRSLSRFAEAKAAAAVVLTLAALFLLRRRLQGPIRGLLSGTRALADGDLDHRIAVAGRDEFSEVALQFNRMAADLQAKQRALTEARDRLEQTVAERTAELRAANAALERADAARRRFFADISHELRTPLTVIRGESEIALRGGDRPVEEYRTALHRIVEQCDHTARLVDDLLFIARADAGEPRITWQAVALAGLIERVCADAMVLADGKAVSVQLRCAVNGAVVSGDPDRLHQLFVILLDNAIRYSHPHGTVTVDVGAGPAGVVVCIRDEGIGIDADELDRVFERFYRGDDAAAHHGAGSGLGLPVAKAIAAAHEGRIVLDSRPGAGTTVSVTLPAVRNLRAIA